MGMFYLLVASVFSARLFKLMSVFVSLLEFYLLICMRYHGGKDVLFICICFYLSVLSSVVKC